MLQVLLGTGETGGKVEVAEVQEGGAPEDALSIVDDSGTVTRVELPAELRSGLFNLPGLLGGGGAEDRRPHRFAREGVNPKHVYLDSVGCYVAMAQGSEALTESLSSGFS